MKKDIFCLLTFIVLIQCLFLDLNAQIQSGRSPISQPYSYLRDGSFTGRAIAESPDPLVSYRWSSPQASDSLQIYLLKPKTVTTDNPGSFENLQSLTGNTPAGNSLGCLALVDVPDFCGV